MNKYVNKLMATIVDYTSIIEIDETGREYKKPWTLEEFIMDCVYIVAPNYY